MDIRERYTQVSSKIQAACAAAGRESDEVTLVAISKRQPDASIHALAALGHRDFGENMIQAWRSRLDTFSDTPIHWHIVGGVQTNKVKFIARSPPALLHTLDRPDLLGALERRLQAPPLGVLIQVNIDEEPQKSGCSPSMVDALADQVSSSPLLSLRGLMCIPRPHAGGPPRAAFSRTRDLVEDIRDRISGPPVLSMGMSADYEAAIAEGSTLVRVGTALFGPRDA